MAQGAVGIVTDGCYRDTHELTLQRGGSHAIRPRIKAVEVQATVGCGGVQVRPGDLVGCDDDGVTVVPLEIAESDRRA